MSRQRNRVSMRDAFPKIIDTELATPLHVSDEPHACMQIVVVAFGRPLPQFRVALW